MSKTPATKKDPTNKYKCAPLIWKKFNDTGKRVYNAVYESSYRSQAVINTHPDAKLMTDGQWNVICHNIACMAAWSAELDSTGQL